MAEALGFAASIIAVFGLAGQVIQGCQNVKTFIGDFKNAPKDIQDLILELDAIEEAAKVTDILRIKTASGAMEHSMATALQGCFDAVQELRDCVLEKERVFGERGSSRRARGWQHLKVVLGKKGIQASVDRLWRAEAQLVVVQSNAVLYLNQCQQKQLVEINESILLDLRISQDSASMLECMNGVVQGMYHQGKDTATVVTSLSADLKRYFKEARQPHNGTDLEAAFERTMERVLQKYTVPASVSHGRRARTGIVPCMSIDTAEHGTPRRELNVALQGPHYRTERKFLCQNSVITVSKTISASGVQFWESKGEESTEKAQAADHSYRYITAFEILIDLGVWRRGLKAVMGRSKTPRTPNLDFRLSTYHIVDKNAPVFQAVASFDIETVRGLFSSGRASPFDQNTEGYSLFDWVIYRLCQSCQLKDAIKGLELLKFLHSCGGMPVSLGGKRLPGNFPWIERAMNEGIPIEIQQILAEAIRLIFQTSFQDPISNWNVGICMTLTSQRSPVAEIVRQQDQWPVELGLRPRSYHGISTVDENDRHIVEDENGVQMAPLITERTRYLAINPTIRGWDAPQGIHSILHLYHESKLKEKIRAGCRKRIIILLKVGFDPRGVTSCGLHRWDDWELEMSVTEYALFTDTFDLWQEALEIFGWTRADVDSLLDEEHYLGVPELLSGELKFTNQAENREEFLQVIANGGYDEHPVMISQRFATYLGMAEHDVWYTLREGRRAFERKSTPGSWHEDGFLNLVLGSDFFVWRQSMNPICYTSFDEYDKGGCRR